MKLILIFLLITLFQFVAFADNTKNAESGNGGMFGKFSGAWNSIYNQLKDSVSNSKDLIAGTLDAKFGKLKGQYFSLEDSWNKFVEEAMNQKSNAQQYLEQLLQKAQEMADELIARAHEMSQQEIEAIRSSLNNLKSKVTNIRDKLAKLGVNLSTEVNGTKQDLLQKMETKLSQIQEILESITSSQHLVGKIVEKIQIIENELTSSEEEISDQQIVSIKSTIDNLESMVISIKEKLEKLELKLWTNESGLKEDLIQIVINKLKKLKQLQEIFESIVSNQQFLKNILEKIQNMADELIEKAEKLSDQELEAMRIVLENIQSMVNAIREKLQKLGIKLWTDVNGFEQDLIEKVENKLQGVKEILEGVKALKESIKNAAGKIKGVVGGSFAFMSKVYKFFRSMEQKWTLFVEKVKHGKQEAVVFLNKVLQQAKSMVSEHFSNKKQMSKQELQTLQQKIREMKSNVENVSPKYKQDNAQTIERVSDELKELDNIIDTELKERKD